MFLTVLFGYPFLVAKDDITVLFFINMFNTIFHAPVVEEILFRGFLQKQFSKILSPRLSISITSILFAAVHFNFFKAIVALAGGLTYGFIFHKTNRLIICIVFHILTNCFGSITRIHVKYIPILQITPLQIITFIFATVIAVYAIRGFMKDDALDIKVSPQNTNGNENKKYDQ
jgi:membrane protease YdiL (CAAX protease family)